MEDYYSILLIDRTATNAEIKVSYKRLALIYHPDRNNEADAEEKFKQISQAYQVLSDTNKRIIYDSSGKNDDSFDDPLILFHRLFPNIPPEVVNIGCKIIKQIHENDNFDMNTIKHDRKLQEEIIELTNILTDQIPEPIKNIFNLLRKDLPDRGDQDIDSVVLDQELPILELNSNLPETKIDVELENPVIEELKMSESIDDVENSVTELVSKEYIDIDLDIQHEIKVDLEDIFSNNSINTSLMVLRYCDDLELDCKICSGKGYYLVKKHFRIPTTYRDIQLLNEGHHNDKEKGNLFIRLNINPSPIYRMINDYDLMREIDVSIYDLYHGNTIYIPHFDKNIGLRISRYVKNNPMTKCIEDLGLPKTNGRGNLYISMNLMFPDNMRDDIIDKYFPQISNNCDLDISKTVEIYRV